MSKIRLHGTSSGYTDIAPTAAAGNNTLTAPTGTGTLVAEDSSGNISISEGLVHTGDTNTKIKFPALMPCEYGPIGCALLGSLITSFPILLLDLHEFFKVFQKLLFSG